MSISHHIASKVRAYMLLIWIIFLVTIFFLPACLWMDLGQKDQDLVATQIALQVEQTRLAFTQAAFTQLAEQQALETVDPPTPTVETLPVVQDPSPTAEPTSVANPLSDPTIVDERTLKSARILVFEDMSASKYIRFVKAALDDAGYFYLDVGSAKGWFKTQLLSQQEWDLVIAAAEARRPFGGEFFEFIDDRVESGASAIIEYWDLDSAPNGRVKPFLDRCGIQFQADWFEPEDRVFYWLDPGALLFNQPNSVRPLRNAAPLWKGDIGDLIAIQKRSGQPAGDAQLLATTNPRWTEDHGLLASCLGGRVIYQSFSSHEYRLDDMIPLWQNYIYQVLTARFSIADSPAPTPVVTMEPVTSESLTPEPLPSGQVGIAYPCGNIFNASITREPIWQRDLFEHHAQGTFLIVKLEMQNQANFPVQIWDDDYRVEAVISGKQVSYPLHKAATGYLYIESPSNLWQDRIEPGQTWRTSLAFDVDPAGEAWSLVVSPGSEFNEAVCQVRVPIPGLP